MNLILTSATLGSTLSLVVPLIIFFIVIYLFIMRPEKKRQQQVTQMQSTVQKNDKIITIGGIHGIVDDVKDDYVIMVIASGARMKVERAAVKKVITEEKDK